MKTKTKKKIINLSVLALLLIATIFASQVFADDPDGKYYRVRTITLADGTSIDEIIINGPPTPPPGYERTTVELPEPNPAEGVNVLTNVPAFNWSFGCSATSAAMIAGYYDRIAYANMYTGPTTGGVMPMDNSSWPDWIDSHGDTRHQCPLSATHNGLDGRVTYGHVDDYWIYYGQPGPDPWDGHWTEHTYGDCTGDYMKTNQWVNPAGGFNTDGGTTFYNYLDGSPLRWNDMETYGIDIYDGGYGVKLFYESRGYTVTDMYNQYIQGQGSNPALGFTYAQYKAEIDAGRPVMIHPTGHTMIGLGYDDATNLMYIHDTWDYSTHTMTWGGIYSGMQHEGVTIVQLAAAAATGTLQGTVTDSSTLLPIANAQVDADGYSTLTNASGFYQFLDLPVGTYEVTASASGYMPSTASGVSVTDGGTTIQDFALAPFPYSIYLPLVLKNYTP
jgi:hypothetical protein